MEINESITPAYRTIANEPPIMIQPADFTEPDAAEKVYTIGVRIVTDQVNYFILCQCNHIRE